MKRSAFFLNPDYKQPVLRTAPRSTRLGVRVTC